MRGRSARSHPLASDRSSDRLGRKQTKRCRVFLVWPAFSYHKVKKTEAKAESEKPRTFVNKVSEIVWNDPRDDGIKFETFCCVRNPMFCSR